MISIRQRQLNLKHYYLCYTGEIDGIEGKQTKAAYKKFQSIAKQEQNGIYDTKTNQKLIEVIKNLQTRLNKYGGKLTVDGYIGEKTIQEIKDFQKKNNLVVDGIAGQNTWNKLNHMKEVTWDEIRYFKKSEFTCRCGCKGNNINMNLVEILENIRKHFGKPIIITSGYRCKKHNQKVGGVQNSRHITGKAADFYVKGISVKELLKYTKQLQTKGAIRYTYTNNTNMNGVVHIDIK